MSGIVITLLVVVGFTLIAFLALFVVGFRAGGQHYQNELQRARFESAQAERALHDLTRQAFIAMSEHTFDKRRSS